MLEPTLGQSGKAGRLDRCRKHLFSLASRLGPSNTHRGLMMLVASECRRRQCCVQPWQQVAFPSPARLETETAACFPPALSFCKPRPTDSCGKSQHTGTTGLLGLLCSRGSLQGLSQQNLQRCFSPSPSLSVCDGCLTRWDGCLQRQLAPRLWCTGWLMRFG